MIVKSYLHQFLCLLLCCAVVARPGKLSQQRYEFSNRGIQTATDVTTPKVVYDNASWSSKHQDSVYALAEFLRQDYNKLVQRQKDIQWQLSGMTKVLYPAQHEIYHVPVELSWKDYFGNQFQYVENLTAQMSSQIIQDLNKGKISQTDVSNNIVFVNTASRKLDAIHSNSEASRQDELQQQHVDIFGSNVVDEEQQQITIPFSMPPNQNAKVRTLVNENVNLPQGQINSSSLRNRYYNIENIEIFTPVSIEYKKTSKPAVPSTTINYYGSTYDEQIKYDLQFLDKNTWKYESTTTNEPPVQSLENSGIMSMLPHKQQVINYAEVQAKVMLKLQEQLNNPDGEHTKLPEVPHTGEVENRNTRVVTTGTLATDIRGDQPSRGNDREDLSYEEATMTQSRHFYYRTTETPHFSVTQINPDQGNTRQSTENLRTLNTPSDSRLPSNPYYSAPLAPFPSTTKDKIEQNAHESSTTNENGAEFQQEENDSQLVQSLDAVGFDDTQQLEYSQQKVIPFNGENLQSDQRYFKPSQNIHQEHDSVNAQVIELTTAASGDNKQESKNLWSKIKNWF